MYQPKTILVAYLYLSSLIALVVGASLVSQVANAYSPNFPASLGQRMPGFTALTVDLMANVGVVAAVGATGSLVCVLVAWRRPRLHDDRCFWTMVVAASTAMAAAMLPSFVLCGFFLLPKLANLS
jgi:hypothetical protein